MGSTSLYKQECYGWVCSFPYEKHRHFRAESRVSIPFLFKGKGWICRYLCHPAPRRYAMEVDGKRELLNRGLFSWMIYFWRCHPAQILKIPNNLECFTAGLNSSFHQLALWSVLHARLPWARCGVCNNLGHQSCPSNVTEASDAINTGKIRGTDIKCKGSTNHFSEYGFHYLQGRVTSYQKMGSKVCTPT